MEKSIICDKKVRFKEQHFIPKSTWPDGPWKNEPDRVSWIDPNTGYSCLIKRNKRSGILCGYVSIENNHPLYEKDPDEPDVDVHGSITYAAHCDGDTEFGICHLTNDNDKSWWFGFDCAHESDLKPYESDRNFYHEWCHKNYRNIAYVTSEVEKLACQLKQITED